MGEKRSSMKIDLQLFINEVKVIIIVGGLILSIGSWQHATDVQVQLDRPVITVWIHGTKVPLVKHICHSFFFVPEGLVVVSKIDPKLRVYCIAKMLSEADQMMFPWESFYCFGWSGKLSFKVRCQAATMLYKQLVELVAHYENRYGCRPYVRLIAHSHGGNVALSMAHSRNASGLVVDELILLACPVQKATSSLITSSIFKQIITIYSCADIIQVMDPQRLWYAQAISHDADTCLAKIPFFSERIFPESSNIIQVQVSWAKNGLSHIDFLRKKFVKKLPSLLKNIYEGYAMHHLARQRCIISC
jgi:hypothetical protein